MRHHRVQTKEREGVAERFIWTFKENLLWIRAFATVAEVLEALREFKRTYNEPWLIERQGFRTPHEAKIDFAETSKDLNGGPARREVG